MFTIETKTATEFGKVVTLYRVVGSDGKGTLWHSSEAKALDHYQRKVEKGQA